jgi:hypothetical protein
MAIEVLMNEIKLLELKLHALKAKLLSGPPAGDSRTTADLYGLLKGADDITPEDVDAVKVKLKEPGI